METLEAIRTRRSIRKYTSESVPQETLEKILEAGTWAPTGMGKQSPIIVAITNKNERDRLMRLNAKMMGRDDIDPFYGAPVVLAVLVDRNEFTAHYDGELVMENMMLAAHDLGLGSCYIFRAKEEFETEEGKALLAEWGIEGDYEGVGHVIVGFPDGPAPEPAPRKADYIRWVQ